MSEITRCAANFEAVTKSDSVNYTNSRVARALYVGGAGAVALVSVHGVAVTFSGVLAGSVLPVQHIRVNSTNTTATNMVALF